VDEPTALVFEFRGCGGNISDLELDAGLGDWDVGGPFGGAETGVRRFREGSQPEVFRPFQLLGEHVFALFALFALKGQAQVVPIERASCVSVSHIRGDTCYYELDIHRLPPL
jgi:hypothetical protein